MQAYREILKKNYEETLAQAISEECIRLTEGQFISRYEPSKPWAIGPFTRDDAYTFHKTAQMKDPTGIGWTSSFLFNPSLMARDGKLYLFYRASVKKESVGSRIGLAVYDPETGWTDFEDNPILYPTEADEVLSVEDPKIYQYGKDRYILFYNGIWRASETDICKYGKYERQAGNIAVDIKYALSSDLLHWEKKGLVVPYEVSRLWAKGAVVARNAHGEAVRIGGRYIMFLSEGCGGYQTLGFSEDMLHWQFERREYLPLPPSLGKHIYEVACAIVDGDRLILDFFYDNNSHSYAGAQALYRLDDPFTPLDYTHNSTLAWGGLLQYGGKWLFAQGWDAPLDCEKMYFYSAPVRRRETGHTLM